MISASSVNFYKSMIITQTFDLIKQVNVIYWDKRYKIGGLRRFASS